MKVIHHFVESVIVDYEAKITKNKMIISFEYILRFNVTMIIISLVKVLKAKSNFNKHLLDFLKIVWLSAILFDK